MRIIAFITSSRSILTHLGRAHLPTRSGPGTWPPLWDQAPEPLANWGDAPAPVPEFVFDQRLGW